MLTQFSYSNTDVSWHFDEKEVEKKIDNIITAFEDNDQKYIGVNIGKNFITQKGYFFDFLGNSLVEYNFLTGEIIWEGVSKVKLAHLIQIGYFPNKNLTLAIYEEGQNIVVFDKYGTFLFEINSPNGFNLQYFQEFPDYIAVVGEGDQNQADKYGRTQFNFKLDLEEKELIKVGIA